MFICGEAEVELPSDLAHNVDVVRVQPSVRIPTLDFVAGDVVSGGEHDYDAVLQPVHDVQRRKRRAELPDGVLDEHVQSCSQKLKARLIKRR